MHRLQDMLDFSFDIRFFLEISEHVQTSSQSSIKESDQERQQNAEEVEDLRKQLSKAAAEACLHFGFLVAGETLHGKSRGISMCEEIC